MRGDEPVGLTTYRIDGDACEIVSLNSLVEETGIGSAPINAVKDIAVSERCRRLWLITTNDNLAALRFIRRGVSRSWQYTVMLSRSPAS